MSSMKGILPLLFIFFSIDTIWAEPSCAPEDQCKKPRPDLRDLVICRTTNLFGASSMDGIIQEVATLFCEGNTVDEIISKFKDIASRHSEPSTYGKMLSVMGPYNDCLKSVNSNMDKALDQFKTGFKQAMMKIIQDGVKALAPYKGQCTSDELFKAMAKYMCPLYTHGTLKNVGCNFIVDKVRAVQGEPTFGCAIKCLDKKVCYLGYYA